MTITKPIIECYQNGNCTVTLYADGTKIRKWSGEVASPEMPESVDLKITDWCDAGCAWCHESSTVRGKHASLEQITTMLADARYGMEVAIGGGDPLSHPDLEQILEWMRDHRLVPNITVNGRHLARHAPKIARLRRHGLFHGLGISHYNMPEKEYEMFFQNHSAQEALEDSRNVTHVIAGIDDIDVVWSLGHPHFWPGDAPPTQKTFLILGYKVYGRGTKHDEDAVKANLAKWRYWLPSVLRAKGITTSFDNLALDQLGVKKLVPEDVWEENYMGDDGTFTMYLDAVTDTFAPTSTSERTPREDRTLQQVFSVIRPAG